MSLIFTEPRFPKKDNFGCKGGNNQNRGEKVSGKGVVSHSGGNSFPKFFKISNYDNDFWNFWMQNQTGVSFDFKQQNKNFRNK